MLSQLDSTDIPEPVGFLHILHFVSDIWKGCPLSVLIFNKSQDVSNGGRGTHCCLRSLLPRISFTRRAPCRGGLEYIGLAIICMHTSRYCCVTLSRSTVTPMQRCQFMEALWDHARAGGSFKSSHALFPFSLFNLHTATLWRHFLGPCKGRRQLQVKSCPLPF